MNKLFLLAPALAAAAGIAACGPSHAARPRVTETARAQVVVSGCMQSEKTLIGVEHCLTPAHHKAAFENCFLNATRIVVVSKADFRLAAESCVVRYR